MAKKEESQKGESDESESEDSDDSLHRRAGIQF